MERNGLTSDMVDWLVPHQANKRIIEATAERAGLPLERVMVTIDKFGNTTAATIPLCLWEYERKLKRGDRLLLAAFGGGFTWGGIYMTWAYDTPAPKTSDSGGEKATAKGVTRRLTAKLAGILPVALTGSIAASLLRSD
jgi:hypothetical protein